MQVLPLHESADAFVSVHESPHAVQLLVVLSVVQVVPPQSVSLHVHAPLTQNGLGCAHGEPLTQEPVGPHVCGVLPLQLVSPGEQTPSHAPAAHVWLAQAVGGPHVPFAVHCSIEFPTHCV